MYYSVVLAFGEGLSWSRGKGGFETHSNFVPRRAGNSDLKFNFRRTSVDARAYIGK